MYFFSTVNHTAGISFLPTIFDIRPRHPWHLCQYALKRIRNHGNLLLQSAFLSSATTTVTRSPRHRHYPLLVSCRDRSQQNVHNFFVLTSGPATALLGRFAAGPRWMKRCTVIVFHAFARSPSPSPNAAVAFSTRCHSASFISSLWPVDYAPCITHSNGNGCEMVVASFWERSLSAGVWFACTS